MRRGARASGQGIILALLLLAGWLAVGRASAQETTPAAATAAAADWLVATHQNDDGGYTAFGSGAGQAASDVAGTADALLALAAAGRPVSAPLGYLESQPEAVEELVAQSAGSAGKLVLALVAAGADPERFAGIDAVAGLVQHFGPSDAAAAATPYDQALAILGLAAAGETIPDAALEGLRGRQETAGELAGSWDDGFGTAGNVDATALAVMALRAAGTAPDAAPLAAAADFLARVQLESGGWGFAPGLPESANSTALALQARSALGQDYDDAMASLLAWQEPGGAFAADFGEGRFDNFFATVQALPALTGQPYPLAHGGDGAAGSHAQVERERTNPTFAWILIALALLAAAAVVVWVRSGKGL